MNINLQQKTLDVEGLNNSVQHKRISNSGLLAYFEVCVFLTAKPYFRLHFFD